MEDKQAVEETVVAEEDGSCILGQNITKAGFHGKPRIFFLFCDLDFIDFFDDFMGIHGYF